MVRQKLRRGLAILLALLLVLSALPFTASATGAQPERNVRTRDQDGYISLHQYITPTDEEDVFQVKMSVRAYLDEPLMDIVYVIDNSLEVKNQWDDIMDGLKAAGEMFLTPEKNPQEKLGADQVRLSVVFFNGKASVLTDLTGSATPGLSGSYYVSEAVDSASTGTTPSSITSPKSTNNYDRKGYDQFVKDVEAAKTNAFSPNGSAAGTDPFKQRYTAKGLGQAYDYLTWQKDEYVNDAANQYLTNKNYNDRAVVFLVSGGGDHLEDFTAIGDIKQNATATAADITGNTMPNVLQEGVLRREAILVAKALKANRKTYADFNGAFTTGTAVNNLFIPKGFDLVTHQLRSSSKAKSGNYVDEVTASKEDRNKKTTGASPAAVDDNPANVFFVNKNLKLRIDADEPAATSGLANPDQDGLAILLDNSDLDMTAVKGVYENIYTYGGMQAEIRSLGIDFLSNDKPTTSSNNEKGSQEHVNNYLGYKKGGAPDPAWVFSSYDDAQYEASANQLLANADKGGPTQTSKNANGQTTNLKTGGDIAAAHTIRGERDYGVLLTTGYRLTFQDLLTTTEAGWQGLSKPFTNVNYPGTTAAADLRPNPPIQDNPMKDNPYYTSLAKGQGPIAGTTGDWNPGGYYGSISGSALGGYSQNWAYTWVWRPSALNTNTAVPGGGWGTYTEGGILSGNSYNDGPAWLGNDVNPWNFVNGSGGLWQSNSGHAQAIINASDPNGNNTIQPLDKNWFHRMVTRPSIVDTVTNTGGTVMDYNTHSVSGLTNGASLSGSDWATGAATGDVNAGTVPLTSPNNLLGQSMQGATSTGFATDIPMTGINTSWPSYLIHDAYNSGQQATYGIGSSSFMQPWVLDYTGVTISATPSSPDDDFSYPTVNGKTTTTLTSSTVGDGDMVNGVRNKHNDWVSEYMMVLAGDYNTGKDGIVHAMPGDDNDWSDTWWTWGSRMVSAEVISNGTKAVGYWSYTPYTYETFGYNYVYPSQTLASGTNDPTVVLTPGTPPYSPTWQETASSTVVNIFARNLAYNYSHKEWNYYEQTGATLKMDGYYKAVHDFEKNTANVKAEGDTLSDYPLYYRYADQNNSTGINTDNNANERQIVYQMKKYAYELYRAANSAYVEAKLSEHFKITKFPGEPMFKIGYSEITIPTVYMDGVGTAVQDGDDTIKWNLDGVYQGAEYMLIFYVHMENRDKLMADTYYPVMDYSYCEMDVRSMFYNGGRRGNHGSGRYATYSQLKHFKQIYVNGKGVVKSDEVEDPKATPTQMLSGVVLPGVFNATLTPTPTSITQIVSDSLEEKDVAVPVTRDNDAKAMWAIGGIVVLLAAASSVVLFKNKRKKEDR